MEESNDGLSEESDEATNSDSLPDFLHYDEEEYVVSNESLREMILPRRINVLDNPVVHMEIELARVQQGMLSPVILLNNVNNVPEVQATIEVRTDGSNDDEDTESIPLGSHPSDESDRQITNSVPEAQATIEIRTEGSNVGEDTEPILLASAPSGGTNQRTANSVSEAPLANNPNDNDDEEIIAIGLGSVSRPGSDRQSSDLSMDQPMVLSDSSPNRSEDMVTTRRKKRRRTASPIKVPSASIHKKEDDDEGLLCSICLDEWTLTGDHRVVSLKCGHLFGMACIKRWMQDKPAASRSCATCKARATMRDIRFIYARCVKAVDNTREEELMQELSREKLKVIDLNVKLHIANEEIAHQRNVIASMKQKFDAVSRGMDLFGDKKLESSTDRRISYKLFLEKNMEIAREGGSRALAYSAKHQMLLISQKSTQPLFPGFCIRMVQVPEFTTSTGATSMLVSSRSVRDIAVDASDDLFACATMEKMVKVCSIPNRSVQCTITPNQEEVLWSCAFDKERPKFLYLGGQRGSVYVYDIQHPEQLLKEFRVGHVQHDYTAVIKICSVEPTSTIPCGGFLVCKLKSVWFFEYTPTQQIESHLLNITGAFNTMSYNPASGLILFSVRPTVDKPTTLVLASLEKLNGVFALRVQHTFEGSRSQTVMYRSAQAYLNSANTLVAAYQEDAKVLSIWCTNSGRRWLQQFPTGEPILDICPIVIPPPGQTYLAALSESRCRIYRLNVE
ncbi:E3 ubiquitin-protein ligase RFWD3 [Anopheles marshallii]|uniref:E3 ubiquitin-protein ligase RFWD3 n=1 Tax=Anopheles marshallii TaxID=1521116 RepID=UPI00237B1A5E|nr:E3 ubiquitin-protein ligase RFWD3 [Anopheles marshallii]